MEKTKKENQTDELSGFLLLYFVEIIMKSYLQED
jgi:hypothetical protein